MCVTYPVSSRLKAFGLNPFDTNALLPKLEFEFVIDCSPPDSARKWFEKPIAKTETAWMKASFDTLTWKLSYLFLYCESGFRYKGVLDKPDARALTLFK